MLPKTLKMMAGNYLERRGWRKGPGAGPGLHDAMVRRPDVVVNTVIDVGASDGRWSRGMMRHFPRAKYLLVEAQVAAHGAALQEFVAAHDNAECVLCAAGDRDGEVHFDASNPFGGVASSTPFAKNNVVVPMHSIDTLIGRKKLPAPYLLKLDTHGFEVPILEGAVAALAQASMLIIEAYNFTLRPGCLRFYELCAYLQARGFRCADMFDLMNRPLDNAFWQMDMVFLPSKHRIFESDSFS
jgi:FkbM family methyltransferase